MGYLESTPLLDLNHLEEAGDGATLTLAAHVNLDAIPLLQLDDKMPMETLETVHTDHEITLEQHSIRPRGFV